MPDVRNNLLPLYTSRLDSNLEKNIQVLSDSLCERAFMSR